MKMKKANKYHSNLHVSISKRHYRALKEDVITKDARLKDLVDENFNLKKRLYDYNVMKEQRANLIRLLYDTLEISIADIEILLDEYKISLKRSQIGRIIDITLN